RRRAAVSLAYPALLLAIMAFIAVLFDTVIMPGFRAMFREFGMNLPKLTTALLAAAGPIAWTLAIGTLVLLVLPVVSCLLPLGRVLSAVVDRVPLLGPIRCYGRLAELSGLMALLVEQEVPLPEALRLAAGAVRAPGLAAECRRAAAAVESGLPLATVFDASCCVPPTMAMLVAWGQQTGSLPQAFHTSATMFQARAERQGLFLETIMLPITFLAVIFFTGVAILALLLPLVSLIQNLSGGGF
ncbi:MAG: type II secretion system F family protein, partial [Thermoguttaceae bacterium]